MRTALLIAAALMLPAASSAAVIKHFPATPIPGGPPLPLSGAVMAGDTLYISATNDIDRVTGKMGETPAEGARIVMENIRRTVEGAGLTMDDVVWMQIFTGDLAYAADFNKVYGSYFKAPMPARAFIGVGSLAKGLHFQVMGVAVKPTGPRQ